MKRRTFLASAGIGLATAVAGCTSQATSNGSPETSSDTTTTPSESAQTETEQTPESTLITAGNTIERTIGNGSLEERGLRKPHHVAFGNPTKKAYQGTIIVSKAGETVFEESVELEANANIIVTLTDLDTYTTRVTVPELEATEEVSIDPSQFTCNVTKTTVSIQKSGALDSVGVSTLMACPGVVSENVGTRESASETLDADLDSGDEKAGSHTLILRNPSEKTWTTRILIENDSMAQFDGIYTIEPEGKVQITLNKSATYTLLIGVLESDTTVTEKVMPRNFDCNQSSTQAEIDAAGEVTVNSLSTLMACDVETDSMNESP